MTTTAIFTPLPDDEAEQADRQDPEARHAPARGIAAPARPAATATTRRRPADRPPRPDESGAAADDARPSER